MSPHSTAGDTLKDLCHIRLYYDTANSYSSALKLVFALYPHWQHEKGDVEFVRFTDGITNTVRRYSSHSQTSPGHLTEAS